MMIPKHHLHPRFLAVVVAGVLTVAALLLLEQAWGPTTYASDAKQAAPPCAAGPAAGARPGCPRGTGGDRD